MFTASLQSGFALRYGTKSQPKFHSQKASPEQVQQRLIDTLVADQGGSPDFVKQVKEVLRQFVPTAMLRRVVGERYNLITRHHIRDGLGAKLNEDNDYISGFHEWGPQGNRVVIGEYLKDAIDKTWKQSTTWTNAVVHELGHALSYVLGMQEARVLRKMHPRNKLLPDEVWQQVRAYENDGVSESPAFKQAWQADFEALPDAIKKPPDNVKIQTEFQYYIQPGANNDYCRARQETFAESVDVLLRGKGSSYNHEKFTRYFPRTLEVMRKLFADRLKVNLPS